MNGMILPSPQQQAVARQAFRQHIGADFTMFMATAMLRWVEDQQAGAARKLVSAFRKRTQARLQQAADADPQTARAFAGVHEEALSDFVRELLKIADAREPDEDRPEGRDGQHNLPPR